MAINTVYCSLDLSISSFVCHIVTVLCMWTFVCGALSTGGTRPPVWGWIKVNKVTDWWRRFWYMVNVPLALNVFLMSPLYDTIS